MTMTFHEKLNSRYNVKKDKGGEVTIFYLDEPVLKVDGGTPLRKILEDMVNNMEKARRLEDIYDNHEGLPPYKDVEKIDITLSDGTRVFERGNDYFFITPDGHEIPADPDGFTFLAAMNLQEALNVLEVLEPLEKEPPKEITVKVTITGQEWSLKRAFGDDVFENADQLKSSIIEVLKESTRNDSVSFHADILSITDTSAEIDAEHANEPDL
jgi:hypothetical protein